MVIETVATGVGTESKSALLAGFETEAEAGVESTIGMSGVGLIPTFG